MSLITQLKADTLTARKNKAPQAAVLRTILGDLETKGKQKGTTVDDTLALSVIKSTIKGLDETITHLEGTTRTDDLTQAKIERDTLTAYLPKVMDETTLRSVVQHAITEGNTNIGSLMGYLKNNHGGAYDGKTASVIVKQELENVG